MQTLTKENTQKAEHLHIRASEQDKKTLAQAARIKNLSISQFLLQTTLPVAQEIVKIEGPDVQTVFHLDPEAWAEFTQLLDAPPRALPELKQLLASRPVWES